MQGEILPLRKKRQAQSAPVSLGSISGFRLTALSHPERDAGRQEPELCFPIPTVGQCSLGRCLEMPGNPESGRRRGSPEQPPPSASAALPSRPVLAPHHPPSQGRISLASRHEEGPFICTFCLGLKKSGQTCCLGPWR